MAVAQYALKVQIPYHELQSLFNAFDLWGKVERGEMTLILARITGRAGTIDRVVNSAGCQVATIHRIYDAGGKVIRTFPESVVVGDVMLWRLGHD